MSFRVVYRREARAEFDRAHDQYSLLPAPMGREFSAAVREMDTRLGDFPRMYGEIASGLRMAVLKRFPFGLIYTFDGDEVLVVSVFHLRRDLNAWLDAYLN